MNSSLEGEELGIHGSGSVTTDGDGARMQTVSLWERTG